MQLFDHAARHSAGAGWRDNAAEMNVRENIHCRSVTLKEFLTGVFSWHSFFEKRHADLLNPVKTF